MRLGTFYYETERKCFVVVGNTNERHPRMFNEAWEKTQEEFPFLRNGYDVQTVVLVGHGALNGKVGFLFKLPFDFPLPEDSKYFNLLGYRVF